MALAKRLFFEYMNTETVEEKERNWLKKSPKFRKDQSNLTQCRSFIDSIERNKWQYQ